MAIGHAFVTFVQDQETGRAAAVGTVSLDSLADQRLAGLLRDGYSSDFLGGLGDLEGETGAAPLEVTRVDIPAAALGTDELVMLVGAVLGANDMPEALASLARRGEPEQTMSTFVREVLAATVLVEHSDAAAMAAAGAVGAAAASAEGTVVAAIVTAGHIGGVALLIASPVGIVIVGVGAAYATWRLLTHRRKGR